MQKVNEESQPREVTIEFLNNEGGAFVYKPAVVTLNIGESVAWKSGLGNFAVFFPRSPFNEVHIRSSGTDTKQTPPVRAEEHATPGTYPYVVAVTTKEGVWIDAGCPEVVIKR